MKRTAPAICLLLLAAMTASAGDRAAPPTLGQLLDAELAAQLSAAAAPLLQALPRGGSPRWLPAVDSRPGLLAELAASPPTIVVELLRVFRGLTDLATPAGRLALFNAVHAVSTMQGITYWSASRGKDRVLFTESWAASAADPPQRIADPVFTSVPPTDRMLSVQVDQTFGRHRYLSTFANRADHLVVRIENADTISWLLLPLMPPGHLVSVVVLVPVAEGLLYAAYSSMTTGLPVVDRPAREASLMNRLVAVSTWLASRLGAAP